MEATELSGGGNGSIESNASPQSSYQITPYAIASLLGKCPGMVNVRYLISKFAELNVPIMMGGETGTGKDLVARIIHENSPRKKGPYIQVNCGALPEGLVESEVFGYEPGAFTGAAKHGKKGLFELAYDGTIFLDELTEMPLSGQAKLLNVIQHHSYLKVGGTKVYHTNARVLSATSLDLDEAVERGKLLEALKYRLDGFTINIPPLRDRGSDKLLLAINFLGYYQEKCSRYVRLEKSGWDFIEYYAWPGNVRQLEHLMEVAVVLFGEKNVEDALKKPNGVSNTDLNSIINGSKTKKSSAPAQFHGHIKNQLQGHHVSDLPPIYILVNTRDPTTTIRATTSLMGPRNETYRTKLPEALYSAPEIPPVNNSNVEEGYKGGDLESQTGLVHVPQTIKTDGLGLKDVAKRAAREAERVAIQHVLEEVRWNRVQAARILKISYKALLYKIQECGLK